MSDDDDDLHGPPSEQESWLAEIAAAPAVPMSGAVKKLKPGAIVDDHYEIEGVLGMGGMGVVYRAFDLTLDRPVALKLHHSTDEKSRERLLREAKVMAKLSHPNVLAVHEVGTWREDVYFAAELVEGVTARQWQRTPRAWGDVVRLYVDAGEGLAAAHRIGLVHRDFKPANILVGDDGRVRVADFGLARPVGPQEQAGSEVSVSSSSREPTSGLVTNLTRTGTRVGTPAYMPPEQFIAKELDGRADQFAFCVSLFEGLYGQRPFPGRTAAAMAAAISLGPQRPSGGARGPRRLYATLRRGLAPDPDDRYACMDDLLAELRVALRPRRHRLWFGAGAFVVVGGAVAMLRAGAPADDDVCTATAQEIDAVWSAERIEVLSRAPAVAGVRSVTPWAPLSTFVDAYVQEWREARVDLCRGLGARPSDVEDRAYACLDESRRELDGLLAALGDTSGSMRRPSLASFQLLVRPAECRDADYLMHSVAPPSDPKDRERAVELQAELRQLRRTVVAPDALSSTLARVDEIGALGEQMGYTPLRAAAGLTRGNLMRHADQAKAAVEVFEDAYFLAHESGDHRLASSVARQLASLVGYTLAKTEPAALWARLAVSEASQGGVPVGALASAEHHLGMVHEGAGHWERAEALYDRALQRLAGGDSDYRLTRAQILVSISALEGGRGKVDEAIVAANEAIALYDDVYGPQHADTVPAIGNIGFALHATGRFAEAYDWHNRAFAITERVYGHDHARAIPALSNLAAAAHAMGDVTLAKRHYADSERVIKTHFGDEHADLALIASNLAMLADDDGDVDLAAELRAKAVRINLKTVGPDAPGTLLARAGLARAQFRAGKIDEGCATFGQLATVIEREQGRSPNLADARSGEGECALLRGEAEPAVSLQREAAKIAVESNAPPQTRASIQLHLANALWEAKRGREARAAALHAKELFVEAEQDSFVKAASDWLDEHPALRERASRR